MSRLALGIIKLIILLDVKIWALVSEVKRTLFGKDTQEDGEKKLSEIKEKIRELRNQEIETENQLFGD